MTKDVAIRLFKLITATNANLNRKVIKIDGESYSYEEAQKIISEEPEGTRATKIIKIFEEWIERYFLEEPEKDIRDLLRLEYKIN